MNSPTPMPPAEAIHENDVRGLLLAGREVCCRFVRSKAARKLRIKVHPDEVEIVVPQGRGIAEGLAFVLEHQTWVVEQLERARQLQGVRRPEQRLTGQILYRGEEVPVKVVRLASWRGPNRVALEHGTIWITSGTTPRLRPSQSLENWLRKQARRRIEQALAVATKQVGRAPHQVYIMDQRTKWGNCSGLGNLSFNWRLIMAPDEVLRYIVTHEVVHLAIPDHSPKFWLTVQSLYPQTDRARQWLVANGRRLMVSLCELVDGEA
ncbi:M48 family metallopeptidase [Thiobaca trueperi]|uniref:YgjP-like metallopeptidase domain-containing protein n=1 Tax=Thiobaca trueperi TaxID=127458 RepID=A0A4R3MX89_9GAMM|nr:SprT family zinc-dependent metalloprotease [Thiobaca trueperi]TCT21208.1 hypothetical protein EDC35_10461 [Thiobaca trueperi]